MKKNLKTINQIISDLLYEYEDEEFFQEYKHLFFDTLTGTHSIYTIKHDSNINKKDSRIFHFDGSPSLQNTLILQGLNKQGVGIYMCVNETTQNEAIIRIRAVFADFDEPIGGITFKNIIEKYDPSMIIDKIHDLYSPTGRYLIFWKVKDVPLNKFGNIQKAIANNLNSNPNLTELSVVVPVPGFVNIKEEGEPLLTEIIYMGDDKYYTWHELKEIFPL